MTRARVLSHPSFRWLWAASAVSGTGEAIQTVAVSWLTFQLTGSSGWVGLVVACRIAPIALLAVPMGSLADRFSRRNIVIWSHVCLSAITLTMALLAFTGLLTPVVLAVFSVLSGIGLAWTLPAWHALYPSSVPDELISPAVGAHTVAASLAGAIGPLIAGAILVAWGAPAAIGINSATYLAVIVAASRLATDVEATPRPAQPGRRTKLAASRLFQVLRRSQVWLFACVILVAGQATSIQTVLPDRVDALFGSADRYGVLLGVFGFGAVAGALARGSLARRIPSDWSVPVLIAVLGCALALFAAMSAVGSMAIVLFGAGCAAQAALSTLEAQTQAGSASISRGRTMSLYVVVQLATGASAAILAGRFASEFGVPRALYLLGLVGVVSAVAIRLLRPRNARLLES